LAQTPYYLPLPWREREGVRGKISYPPLSEPEALWAGGHLNPPPSRGRIILANFHGSWVTLRHEG